MLAAMDNWETELAQAVASDATDGILGAIGLVIDGSGRKIYHHAAGKQSLDDDAGDLDPNSSVSLGSAGKFITHIGVLQLIERGRFQLDDSVSEYLPELDKLPIIEADENDASKFSVRRPSGKITYRHMLTHSSGLSDTENPLVQRFFESKEHNLDVAEDAHKIVELFSMPLLFEPGEGFAYGASIYWLQLLFTRATEGFVPYIEKNVFQPLGMTASSYMPDSAPHIWNKRLHMVERKVGSLMSTDDATQGLMCSMEDMGLILGDLVSSQSKLLKPESIDLLFSDQLSKTARLSLRRQHDEYKFCTGELRSGDPPAVTWSFIGLLAEDALPLSGMPRGTVTWEGMPNVMWAVNRERGLGMLFGTQLLPVGDVTANRLANTFMKDAWETSFERTS